MTAVAWAILRVSRVVADLERAVAFYRDALACEPLSRQRVDAGTLADLGIADGHAAQAVLRLGGQHLALVQFSPPGRPYPPDSRSDDLWFQHLAIVVSDMDAAYRHLASRPGWRPISHGGPQTLPASNGGVRAFKFRDPDGHPLELIWFPPGQGRAIWHRQSPAPPFLGIDHSAIAVADGARSLAFYEGLGLRAAEHSLNTGPAQTRLDGLADARVSVTGLRPASAESAGLEMLAYAPPGRGLGPSAANDIATDWVTLAVTSAAGDPPRAVRDPDGHRLLLVAHGGGTSGTPA